MRLTWLLPLVLLAACAKAKSAAEGERPARSAEAQAPKAAGGSETKPASAEQGPFSDFAKVVNDAADAVEKAARGEKVDGPYAIESLDGTDKAKLEGAKRLFTTAEIEAMSAQSYVRTNVLVFPDGRIRWVGARYKPERAYVSVSNGLDEAAPVLAKTTRLFIETLSGDSCKLPVISAAEIAKLPDAVKGELKDVQPQIDALCAAMKGKSDGWLPRYDDMTVVLQVGDALVSIKSGIEVKGGKLVLNKPRVR